MIFWMVCAVLTVAVVVATLRPIMQQEVWHDQPINADLDVYKQQLSEVDRDVARGLLSAEEADAARIEISRRILAIQTDKDEGESDVVAGHGATVVFYAFAALMVTSALGFYLVLGSPGYGGKPFAERASRAPQNAPVQELIARVEARLREAPNDGQGWDVLAPVYLKQGRNADAARAFERAIALLGESRARLRGLAEAHLAASNGIVGRQVREAYSKILAKEPHLIAPRFWLAVGLEQDGKRDDAAAAYRNLLRNGVGDKNAQPLPPSLRRLIEERLAAVTGTPTATDRNVSQAGKGPPPPKGMASAMSPKERAAMIEKMVSGLAARLRENGGSQQEWQRLIRAYWVLGRRDEAAKALVQAKKQYASDANVTLELDAFANSLGMKPG